MARSLLARDRGPLVSIHGLEFACTDFVSYASRGYELLSDLYEEQQAIGVQQFLERVGAIRLVEWRQRPSQCRRLAKALLNATMVLQSMVGDNRDLQSVIKQKRVRANASCQ
ncbi:MAG: hypothetical protein N4J56_006618 [Chroococcidiopsis sp. SAG 2025]|uniref:hypothetical protein n=1 Tax=Chroococcidiopsis sp. SAG 2025 TaxID=171389 RepID=UPI00293707C4|nr:hypothetical protein [Chroococcidiopsis sp. SAG 2025]MDV2996913.1 hypothetical protein [Chroococcidiopsis sp. SAG 2025]